MMVAKDAGALIHIGSVYRINENSFMNYLAEEYTVKWGVIRNEKKIWFEATCA